ncbi:uncharacterized protein LOC123384769 isoform X7 [Felis catus]|nr:uncharacterized protein LOC123384769 isoform X7 [Felis catus]
MKMEMSDTSSSRPRLILELGSVPTLSSFLLNEDEVHRVPSKYDQMLDEKADDGSFLEEVCKPQHTPCVQRPPSGAIGTLIHTNPVSRSPQHFEVSPWLANRCQRGASAHSLYGVTVKGQGQQQIPCSPASAGGAKQRAREGLLRGLLFPQNRPRTSGRVLLELKPLAVIRMNRLNVRGTRSKPNFHHGK